MARLPARGLASRPAFGAGWGTALNIFAGAYFGGLIVCAGSLYLVYHDADTRQHIPFELAFADQLTAVKAISKDDVLRSPRYAVKHYRRLLLALAQHEDSALEFAETHADGLRNYAVPLIAAPALLRFHSKDFANFYIDIVLRYAKALLAKGQYDVSVALLQNVIDDDDLFFRVGDPERMAQCCRLLSKVCPSTDDRVRYLQRTVGMLAATVSNVLLDADYLLRDGSRITDELLLALDGLACNYARMSGENRPRGVKKHALTQALNIYLANLKVLSSIKQSLDMGELTQAAYPLFNCDEKNLNMAIAETKAHISEVLWAKGYKQNAVAWGEEVVEEVYFDHSNNARASPLLISVLSNLVTMYAKLKNVPEKERCEDLLKNLSVFMGEPMSWYDSVVNRFTRIIYYRGPLGVIEKALKERFGAAQPLPDIEEYEDEDEED